MGEDARRGEERSLNFPSVEFDLQSANIKVRPVPPGNRRTGLRNEDTSTRRGAGRASCISRGASALGIRLEFVRVVSSIVTSSQERRQFCFIASGRESFSETLLQEVPPGRLVLSSGDEIQPFFGPGCRNGPEEP